MTKAAVAIAATGAAFVATTGTAMAAGPGGVEACPSGAFCVYYNSSEYGWGSFTNWTPAYAGDTWDLHNFTFGHYANGSGYGETLYSNIAAVVNNTGVTWQLRNGFMKENYVPGFSGNVGPSIYNAEDTLAEVS